MVKKRNGIIGTLLFHGTILLVMVFLGFSTPLPLPEEEGILINFGIEETGSGEVEPRATRQNQEEELSVPAEIPPVTRAGETPLTQEFEEAPAVDAEPVRVAKEETVETKSEEVTEEPEEKVPEETAKINQRALYKGRTDDPDDSEGITRGEGNQGSTTGTPDAGTHAGALSQDTGGVTWSLAGRNPISLPKPEYKYQLEGTVVVRINVDRDGRVTSAEPGFKGSNTIDRRLLEAAREAALKARFDSQSDAAFQQQGTLTYRFILQ